MLSARCKPVCVIDMNAVSDNFFFSLVSLSPKDSWNGIDKCFLLRLIPRHIQKVWNDGN